MLHTGTGCIRELYTRAVLTNQSAILDIKFCSDALKTSLYALKVPFCTFRVGAVMSRQNIRTF